MGKNQTKLGTNKTPVVIVGCFFAAKINLKLISLVFDHQAQKWSRDTCEDVTLIGTKKTKTFFVHKCLH